MVAERWSFTCVSFAFAHWLIDWLCASPNLDPIHTNAFEKYPFLVSSKTHRSIRVQPPFSQAFSTVHTKTLEKVSDMLCRRLNNMHMLQRYCDCPTAIISAFPASASLKTGNNFVLARMKNGYGVPIPALWWENLERANALTTDSSSIKTKRAVARYFPANWNWYLETRRAQKLFIEGK